MSEDFSNIDKQDEYLDFYPRWILSSKLNKLEGLEAFKYRYISLGCTQALDEFHFWCSENNLRIRMFRGEYPYNRDCINFDWSNDFIDDQPLKRGDAVIVSAPFSGSGKIHPHWENLITTCNQLEIPIFVDCAFFGTCSGINLNFNHDCITSVVFSTTKGLSCGNYRNGIQFTKIPQGHLAIQNEWHHGIHLNVAIGLYLMQNFSPDFLYEKYQESYLNVCDYFQFKPTNCIHLALGDEKWEYFSRDNAFYRIGVKNAVKQYFRDSKKGKTFSPNG
jgi:hypothetical protein